MSREKILQWAVPFFVATAVSAFVGYVNNDKAVEARLAVVETAQGLDRAAQGLDRSVADARLNRLEQKVDRVLELLIRGPGPQ